MLGNLVVCNESQDKSHYRFDLLRVVGEWEPWHSKLIVPRLQLVIVEAARIAQLLPKECLPFMLLESLKIHLEVWLLMLVMECRTLEVLDDVGEIELVRIHSSLKAPCRQLGADRLRRLKAGNIV